MGSAVRRVVKSSCGGVNVSKSQWSSDIECGGLSVRERGAEGAQEQLQSG